MPKDEMDPQDPNELVGVVLQGSAEDEEQMAYCLVDEYVRMGMGAPQLLEMFKNPFYQMTHGVYLRRGETYVRSLIDKVLAQWSGGAACRM